MMNSAQGEEQPASWLAIAPNTPVFSLEEQEVGTVSEVLGWDQEDIFHGLVVQGATPDDARLIPAEHVRAITTRRVQTDLSSEQIRSLGPYLPRDREHAPPSVAENFLEARESE